jgi:hypothetical protein
MAVMREARKCFVKTYPKCQIRRSLVASIRACDAEDLRLARGRRFFRAAALVKVGCASYGGSGSDRSAVVWWVAFPPVTRQTQAQVPGVGSSPKASILRRAPVPTNWKRRCWQMPKRQMVIMIAARWTAPWEARTPDLEVNSLTL